MKKIIMLITTILFIVFISSCMEPYKYKSGDIVYLKPDSSEAVVIDNDVSLGEKTYYILTKNKNVIKINESCIFGKKIK